MGTTLVKEAVKNVQYTDQSDALQFDHIVKQNSTAQNIDVFPDHSNIQNLTYEHEFFEKATQKSIFDDLFTGFANSEHVVKLLQDACKQQIFVQPHALLIAHEQFFTVHTDKATADYTFLQHQRILMHYIVFMRKTETKFTQQDFFEYFDKFLSDNNATPQVQRQSAALNAGLHFALSMLKQLYSISPLLLEDSLRHLLQALINLTPGSLYGIDIFAFQQDATLNSARNFLVTLVQDRKSQSESLVELCLKTILRLGIARSNAEDILLVATLIKNDLELGNTVDLRKEIMSLPVRQTAKNTQQGVTLKETKGVLKASLKYSEKIDTNYDFNGWTTDGKSIIMCGTGLVKINLPTDDINTIFDQEKNQNVNKKESWLQWPTTCCFLNDKLYFRQFEEVLQVFDPETLQLDKESTKLIAKKFAEQSGFPNLNWMKEADPVTGRLITSAPIFTDGTYLYTVSRKHPVGLSEIDSTNDHVALVIEKYCPIKWRHIESVTLMKNEVKCYRGKQFKNIDDLLIKSSFHTNGRYLLICQHKKRHLFDMVSGLRVDKRKDEDYICVVLHDYQNNRFLTPTKKTDGMQHLLDFTIDVLSVNNKTRNFQQTESQHLNLIDKIKQDYLSGCISTPPISIKKLIMSKQTADEKVAHQQPLSPKSGQLVVAILLEFLSQSCQDLQNELKKIDSLANPSEKYLNFFHWPNATYLTETLFECLRDVLNHFKGLVDNQKTEENLSEQVSLLYTLRILSANFAALNYCGVKLNEIFDNPSSLTEFQNVFKATINPLTADCLQKDGPDKQNFSSLWEEIHSTCIFLMTYSVSLLSEDAKDAIANLATNLQQSIENDNCAVYLKFLTSTANMNKVLQFQTSQVILNLNLILKSLQKIYIERHLVDIQSQQPFEPLQKIRQFSLLQQACDQFERHFFEQLLLNFEHIKLELSNKVVWSAAAKQKRAQDELIFEQLLSLITQVFVMLCTRNAKVYSELHKQIQAAFENRHSQTVTDEEAQSYRNYFTRMHILLTAPQNTYLLNLYLTTMSQICTGQPNMFAEITNSATILIKSTSELTSHLKMQKNIFAQGIKEPQKNNLQFVLKDITRKACWLVGSISLSLLRVKKSDDKKQLNTTEEKMTRMLMESKLLSGGIENRFLNTFEPDTKQKLQFILEINKDQQIIQSLYQEEDRVVVNEEDQIFDKIMKAGQDIAIDKLLEVMQAHMEKHFTKYVHARLNGEVGMNMTRVVFAVNIKFAQLVTYFQDAIDQMEMTSAYLDTNLKKNDQLNQILIELSGNQSFKKVLDQWIESSQIRRWITEKKRNLSLKIEKKILETKPQSQQIPDIQQSEVQIDTNSIFADKDLKVEIDEQQFEEKLDQNLNEIFEKIIEKAQYLLKMQVPTSYGNTWQPIFDKAENDLPLKKVKSLSQKISNSIESQEKEIEIWQTIKESTEKNVKVLQSVFFKSPTTSVIACLLAPINVVKVQKHVELDFLKASRRIAGLFILSKVMCLPLEKRIQTDLTNWFTVGLRNNSSKLCHYITNINCCGNYTETKLRQYFFNVIGSIIEKIKTSRSQEQIVLLADALKWKFMGRDHAEIIKLQIFKCLREGDGAPTHPIKQVWGKKLNQQKVQKEPLVMVILDIFESLALNILSRVIEADFGQDMQLKSSGTNIPALEKSKSIIQNSVSEILMGQAFNVIFQELTRYVDQLKNFGGFDYQTYNEALTKHQQKNRSDNKQDMFGDQFKDELLFDMDQKQQQNEIQQQVFSEIDSVQFIKTKLNDKEIKLQKSTHKLYDGAYLRRLLRIFEIFTSAAKNKQHIISIVKSVATTQKLFTLFQLFILAEPRNQIILLKIIRNLTQIEITAEQFEEPLSSTSLPEIQQILQQQTGIKCRSLFLTFWISNIFNIRKVMYRETSVQSEGSYEVSQEIARLLNYIIQLNIYSDWQSQIKTGITEALLKIETLSNESKDLIFCLLPGTDYTRMSTGSLAITETGQLLTILGSNSQNKIVGLFYDNDHKEQQEIIEVFAHSLKQINQLESDNTKSIVMHSVLCQPDVIRHLVNLIVENKCTPDLQLKILKSIQHLLNVLKAEFINVLKENALVQPLLAFLLKLSIMQKQDFEQIPVSWLEAKIASLRAYYIENAVSLEKTASIKCQVLQGKQLLFSHVDSESGDIVSMNAPVVAILNARKINDQTSYTVGTNTTDAQQNSKQIIHFVDFEQISALDLSLLKVMRSSEAIITYDVKLRDLIVKITQKVQELNQQNKTEDWSNVLDCIIFVIKKEKFLQISQASSRSFYTDMNLQKQVCTEDRFEDFKKQCSEWGELDLSTIMYDLCKINDRSTLKKIKLEIPKLIMKVQLNAKKQAETIEKLFRDGKDNQAIDQLEKQEQSLLWRKNKVAEILAEGPFLTTQVLQELEQILEIDQGTTQLECQIYNFLDGATPVKTKNLNLIQESLVNCEEIEESSFKKTDSELQNAYQAEIKRLDKLTITKNYEKTLIQLNQAHKRQIIFDLLSDCAPYLLGDLKQRKLLSSFLKKSFTDAFKLQTVFNSNSELDGVKQTIHKLFEFCLNEDQTFEEFVHVFIREEIIQAGENTMKKFDQSKILKSIADHFSSDEDIKQGLHPGLLVYSIQLILKFKVKFVLESKSYLPALLGLAIAMFAAYWKVGGETTLPLQLLKECQNIILFTQDNLKKYIWTGVVQKIINCPLITHLVSHIGYKQKKCSFVQQQLLEVYLSMITLLENVQKTNSSEQIISNLDLNEGILEVKRALQILSEKFDFDFLMYFLHQKSLNTDQLKQFNESIGTVHPHYNVLTRSRVCMDVARFTVSSDENTDLKPYSLLCMSRSKDGKQGSGSTSFNKETLKSTQNAVFTKNFKDSQLYTFYPVQKQMLLSFGVQKRGRMGEMQTVGIPQICKETMPFNLIPTSVKTGRFSTFLMTDQNELYISGSYFSESNVDKFTKFTLPMNEKGLQEIPDKIFNGRRCKFVIAKSGKTFFCGRVKDDDWPQEMRPTNQFKEFKLNHSSDFDEKIVDISCGSQFALFVTDKGKVWATGKKFLSEIGNTNKDLPQNIAISQSNLFALRVWASDEKRSPFALIQMKDKLSGKLSLCSIGKCDDGGLGQGTKNLSKIISILDYNDSQVQFVDASLNQHFAMAIDQDGLLWAWGRNKEKCCGSMNTNANIKSPTKVLDFERLGLKALKVSVGRLHALVLAQDNKGEERLYSIGQADPQYLGCTQEESKEFVRKIPMLATYKIVDFSAGQHFNMVIIEGSKTLTDGLYQHILPNGKQANGLLHVYYQNGRWKYIAQEDYELTDGRDLPDICIAFKCPIPEMDRVINGLIPLIKVDLQGLLDTEKSQISNVVSSHSQVEITSTVYQAQALIGSNMLTVNLSEQEILNEVTKFDVHPLIYFRLKKPLKDGAQLPILDLKQVYGQTSAYGFQFELKPDFGWMKSTKLLELTKDQYNSLSSLVQKFPVDCDKELYQQMDKQVPKHSSSIELKDFEKYNVATMTWSKDSKLKEVDAQVIKTRMNLIWYFNYFFTQMQKFVSVKSIQSGAKNQNMMSVASIMSQVKHLILPSVKLSYVKRVIEQLKEGPNEQKITIQRNKAQEFAESGAVDHTAEYTLYGQVMKKLQGKYDNWKQNNVDARALKCVFEGEDGTDAGGLFRELLTNFVAELESGVLPLIMKTANQKTEHGEYRNCFMVNFDSKIPTHQEMFKFLGVLIGFAFRTGSCMPFNFIPSFWKQLIGETVTELDLKTQDTYLWQTFRDLRALADSTENETDFETMVDQNFIYVKSDSTKVELCKGGEQKQVNKANLEEFIKLTCDVIFEQNSQQVSWIQEGMKMIIPFEILTYVQWSDFEDRVCGSKETDVAFLKSITQYDGCSEDTAVIKFFWNIMGRMSEEDKSAYLKFTWGRQRLPHDTQNLKNNHKIKLCKSYAQNRLPEAHTCFFTLDIPEYQSEETMERLLLLAIRFCGDIANT